MLKPALITVLGLFISFWAAAQKDSLVYYLKNTGTITLNKDSAVLRVVILPPDSTKDKKISVVKCYYPNGKIYFIAGSKTHDLPLSLEGPYKSFYENGHRKSLKTYRSGQVYGDVTEYYPNGKLYTIKHYSSHDIFLKECDDSTGTVLAKHGEGEWKEYDDDFKKVVAAGHVKGEVQEGLWAEMAPNDTVYHDNGYKDGHVIFSSLLFRYTSGGDQLSDVDVNPEFPGGKAAFSKFVADNLNYPEIAKKNGTHGRVMVAFIVEKNGYVDNIRIVLGIGDGCDEEAMRIIQASPNWMPGTKDGQPVRTQHATAVDFNLSSE